MSTQPDFDLNIASDSSKDPAGMLAPHTPPLHFHREEQESPHTREKKSEESSRNFNYASGDVKDPVKRRQLETLLGTAKRGAGRDILGDPIMEPQLQREYGLMRFFKATYGFVFRPPACFLHSCRTSLTPFLASITQFCAAQGPDTPRWEDALGGYDRWRG